MTTDTKFLEREEKQNFPTLNYWSDELVLSISEGFAPFSISRISQRSYRSFRRDSLDNALQGIHVDLRRRGTLILPWGRNLRDVDPQDRRLDKSSLQMCYKTSGDLGQREEYEVVDRGKGSKTRRRLNREAGGKLLEAFEKACIHPCDIVDKATYDVERLYFETRFDVAPDGEIARKKNAHTAKIIVALCLDAGDVLLNVGGRLMAIDKMSTQVEREIKRKQCPHEGASDHVTDRHASPVQVEAAMAHSLATLRASIPSNIWTNVVTAEFSKAAEADTKTELYHAIQREKRRHIRLVA